MLIIIGIILLLIGGKLSNNYMKKNSPLMYQMANNDSFDDNVKELAKNQMIKDKAIPKWVSLVVMTGWVLIIIGIIQLFI